MRIMKKILFLILMVLAFFTFSACQALDVVGQASIISFDALLKIIPGQVSSDSSKEGWAINASDGQAKIILSKDFSRTQPDIWMEFDAVPFINAGLDVAKLPTDIYTYDLSNKHIILTAEYGQDQFEYNGEATAIDTFKEIIRTHRKILGYHENLEHFGIPLGNGNMFEFAKDIDKNDLDMVFALNPSSLLEAGVNPSKLEGWVVGKVEVMSKDGEKVLVDKFLKPFNLK